MGLQLGGLSGLFGRKPAVKDFDRERLQPTVRCSICNGEQVAGFRDRQSGVFNEVMFLRDDRDRRQFCAQYGLTEDDLVREW